MLLEIPLAISDVPIPPVIDDLARTAIQRSKAIDCFDFVPSSFSMVYRVLHSLPRGAWCEWGSGMGINTGIAAFLGYNAVGIEIDPRLASASREILDAFGLSTRILDGSYFEIPVHADLYFVYCWPGQMSRVEDHFCAIAPNAAKLLICHGEDDVRCKVKAG